MARDEPARREIALRSGNGYLMFLVGLALLAGGVGLITGRIGGLGLGAVAMLMIVFGGLSFAGLYMLQPNEAAIQTLFGQYRGTDRSEGLRWTNPLYARKRIALRA